MSPIAYAVGAVLSSAAAGWFFWRGDAFAGLVFLPVAGFFVGRCLVIAGFDAFAWLRRRELREWNGIYYEFGTIHLRAIDTEAGLVFVEDDLLAVIAQPGSRTLELFGPAERVSVAGMRSRALTREGCERLLMKCPHRDAKGLLLYLQREAFGPYAKRNAGLRQDPARGPSG